MKAITLENRIAKSNNANGSTPNNNRYQKALKVLTSNGSKVYFNKTSGIGRYTTILSDNPHDYLTDWGIDFEYGNDAPRGGKLGEFIQLTAKGKRQCKEYYQQYMAILEECRKRDERIAAELQSKKEAGQKEFERLVGLIENVEGEELNVTAGRLKVALQNEETTLPSPIFWKVVKVIRKK